MYQTGKRISSRYKQNKNSEAQTKIYNKQIAKNRTNRTPTETGSETRYSARVSISVLISGTSHEILVPLKPSLGNRSCLIRIGNISIDARIDVERSMRVGYANICSYFGSIDRYDLLNEIIFFSLYSAILAQKT